MGGRMNSPEIHGHLQRAFSQGAVEAICFGPDMLAKGATSLLKRFGRIRESEMNTISRRQFGKGAAAAAAAVYTGASLPGFAFGEPHPMQLEYPHAGQLYLVDPPLSVPILLVVTQVEISASSSPIPAALGTSSGL